MTKSSSSPHLAAESSEDLSDRFCHAVRERTVATAPEARAAAGQAILDLDREMTRRGLSAWAHHTAKIA